MTPRFAALRGFLLDMDGTVYLGDQLLPGAREFWALTQERGIPVQLLTNNSSRNRDSYARKLSGMALAVRPDQILTSGEATAEYLQVQAPRARVALFGTPDLEREFVDRGFVLSLESPEYVILGFDTTIDYAKFTRLCDLVRSGIPYIATHPDLNCPIQGGVVPDIGAMMAFVAASTGRQPDIIIGKPNRHIVDMAAKRMALPVECLCMVGDRLYTDIAMGQHAPLQTALVLTGETKRADLATSPFQPDYILRGLDELAEYVRRHFRN